MRIGLVGTGRIGASHAAVIASRPEVSELVVADADTERARAVAGRVGASLAATAEELTAPGAIDALVVTAATDAHPALITAGVRAGIPVFCEKPVAPTVAGTVEVLRAVEEADALVHIGFQRRFDAGYIRARAALRDGELGTLHRVHAITADPAPPHASYIPTSGGIFRDCHVHDFDIVRWVTGREVVDVYALGSNRGADFFAEANDVDNSVALLRLDDGTLATLHGSRYNGGGYDVRMELAGDRATIAVGLDERVPLRSAEPGTAFPAQAAWPDFWTRFTPAYEAEIVAFLQLVKDGGPSPCGVADALEAVLIAEAADRSRREGRPVTIAEVRPTL
ncbi:Gfo/Idh/MocA family protein [Nocardiopsis ansamitocini]|uniref:Myo-inositol 2-dehydrogenase n=1 Tax=Nocardiopsis ansamitocini TaxID=1670832 RepID=A0A9W6UGH7_9ACTN|nr:Gfo/Idh/MocA family oxidoreductase [Nocardiopsis ansamitocini]GLU47491.1 myo-inositol 2-dehydrogenase [Nocardiopsis ansamitocini]